jgi:hypothetical protein
MKLFMIMGTDHVFCTDCQFVCGNGVTVITRFRHHEER